MYHKLMMENQSIYTKLVFERLKKLTGKELSIGQPKILEHLYLNDGSFQKDIASACQIEQATLTNLLSRMEKNDLVKRTSKEGDKRYIYVYLTEKGKKAANYVMQASEDIESIALNNFSKEEKERFIQLLKKVNINLKERKEADMIEQKGSC